MTNVRVCAVGSDASFRPYLARALHTAPEAIGWMPSLEAANQAVVRSKELVDVIVLAPSVSETEALAVANVFAREAPATAVVLVRAGSIDGAFPRLVRAGVRDVVDLSRGEPELEEALNRAIEWSAGIRARTRASRMHAAHAGHIVSVFSTKGGTGKTFLACNLAGALASQARQPVALLDLDHDLGDVFAYFGTEPKRSLHDVVALDQEPDGDALRQLGTPLPGNIVGFGSPPDPRARTLPTEAVATTLRSLRQSFAYTVVDAGSEYSEHVLGAFDISDVICCMATLDVIGVRHISLTMQTLESLGVPSERLRVVLNRANARVDLSADEVERLVGIRVDARIPSSAAVPRSVNHGKLLVLEEPRSDVARSVTTFAERLHSQFATRESTPDGPKPRRLRRG